MDPDTLLARYEAIFAGIDAPFAFVDLDAFDSNAARLLERAGGKRIRVASKSLRVRALLDRALQSDPRYRGLMCFTLSEALWLARLGYRDLLVGYPTVDRAAISDLATLAADPEQSGSLPILMVDDVPQLDLIEGAVGRGRTPIEVAIDIDLSWRPLGRRGPSVGPKRSPRRTIAEVRSLAEDVLARPGLRLVGLMAYEGQIAGVGDQAPRQAVRNLAIRGIKRASYRELRERRAAIVSSVRELADLRFVNGGGTGSLHLNADEPALDELTAGSGLFAPALFDHYRDLELAPAAAFALPIVRRSDPGTATALGGGYVASGPAGPDRLPEPFMPAGLRLAPLEGAGETQTPVVGPGANSLRIGDRIYMRHAKAGELCERFNSLYLIAADAIVDQVPTYRGEGRAFL